MSDELLRKLRALEEDYVDQPSVVQQGDLQEINQLRSQLGLPIVDAQLKATFASTAEAPLASAEASNEEAPKTFPSPAQPSEADADHAEARQIYQQYLQKTAELEPHREYALRIANATAGSSQTPVRPLATMGTNGGPLLCDVCGKPLVLEGGRYHKMTADAAWRRNSTKDWNSYILGGMVVELQSNGTIRIYHGYSGRNDTDCCNVASQLINAKRKEFDSGEQSKKWPSILAFIEDEFPDMNVEERCELLNAVLFTVFGYDPGIGINRPAPNA